MTPAVRLSLKSRFDRSFTHPRSIGTATTYRNTNIATRPLATLVAALLCSATIWLPLRKVRGEGTRTPEKYGNDPNTSRACVPPAASLTSPATPNTDAAACLQAGTLGQYNRCSACHWRAITAGVQRTLQAARDRETRREPSTYP